MEEILTLIAKYPLWVIVVATLIVNSPAILKLLGKWGGHIIPTWMSLKKEKSERQAGESQDIVVLLKELLKENRDQLDEARGNFNQLARDSAIERQNYVRQMELLLEKNARRDARFTEALVAMTESMQAMISKLDKLCILWEVYQRKINGR